jgi:hypothetical protein
LNSKNTLRVSVAGRKPDDDRPTVGRAVPRTTPDLVPVISGRPIDDRRQLAFGATLAHIDTVIRGEPPALRRRRAGQAVEAA